MYLKMDMFTLLTGVQIVRSRSFRMDRDIINLDSLSTMMDEYGFESIIPSASAFAYRLFLHVQIVISYIIISV